MTDAASSGPPMTIVRLEIDSFKRLRAARLEPTPSGLVPVRGRNGAGKTSLIESLEAALLGTSAAPEMPIAEGSHGARVVLDLGEIVVRRDWRRDSAGKATSSLSVENAHGAKSKSPQAVLDGLLGHFADPVQFLGMKSDEQVRVLLAQIGLDQELSRLEAKRDVAYAARRDVGRDADRARKAVESFAKDVAAIVQAPKESRNAEQLGAELQVANEHNAAIEAETVRQSTAEHAGRNAAAAIEKMRAEIAQLEAEIVRLRDVWSSAEERLNVLGGRVDVEPIREGLRQVEQRQRERVRIETLGRLEQDAERTAAEHRAADALLEESRAAIADLLRGTRFPVDGMSYDPDAKRLLVNGIPFSQASHAERLRISAAIAMSGEPRIRVAFIREGSMLDEESLAMVAAIAQERGFQLWCELVDSKREGPGVWIEDGEATQ